MSPYRTSNVRVLSYDEIKLALVRFVAQERGIDYVRSARVDLETTVSVDCELPPGFTTTLKDISATVNLDEIGKEE